MLKVMQEMDGVYDYTVIPPEWWSTTIRPGWDLKASNDNIYNETHEHSHSLQKGLTQPRIRQIMQTRRVALIIALQRWATNKGYCEVQDKDFIVHQDWYIVFLETDKI